MKVEDVSSKEGFWVRIGEDSYAAHRVLSVSVTNPQTEDMGSWYEWVILIGALAAGIFFGVQAGSWIVGIIAVIILEIPAVLFVNANEKRREKKQGFPRDVVIQLDKKGPRVVAAGIPKIEAEKMQQAIEQIVADASEDIRSPKSDEQGVDPGA